MENSDDNMKYLIAGLGNIGMKYENTRHNIGFEVVDAIAEKFGASFGQKSQAMYCEVKHKGRTIILIKPTNYMNLSGKAVRYWMQKLNIPVERTLVIVDDIHLDFGVLRLKAKGSSGGHNGLKSVEQMLGTSTYIRLKMGIGNNFYPGQQSEYVLGEWDAKERSELEEFVTRALASCLDFVSIGLARTMNAHNR